MLYLSSESKKMILILIFAFFCRKFTCTAGYTKNKPMKRTAVATDSPDPQLVQATPKYKPQASKRRALLHSSPDALLSTMQAAGDCLQKIASRKNANSYPPDVTGFLMTFWGDLSAFDYSRLRRRLMVDILSLVLRQTEPAQPAQPPQQAQHFERWRPASAPPPSQKPMNFMDMLNS